jgi:restriction endonuclease S subunit
MPRTSWSKICDLKFPVPSFSEQQTIVDFLDYKTGQCDRFIANRQKQIELVS